MEISESKTLNISAMIVNLLRDSKEGLKEESIYEELQKRKASVAKALKELLKNNSIDRSGTGKKGDPYIYSVPANAVPPLEGDYGSNNISDSSPDSNSLSAE